VVVRRRKRAGGPREKEGEELPRDDEQVCAADKARIHLAGTSGQHRDDGTQGKFAFSFISFFRDSIGVCVCVS